MLQLETLSSSESSFRKSVNQKQVDLLRPRSLNSGKLEEAQSW